MLPIPPLEGLSWTNVRSIARELATSTPADDVAATAVSLLDAPDVRHRMLAVFLLGYSASARPANLDILRHRVTRDPNWEVQEGLAHAFDTACAALGYEAALPMIDAWLADPHPNARRAVSEGLRPWTARSRLYFAQHPIEAIRRLAALRHDPSDFVRHSAGNALRDIRRRHPDLVDAETATWNLANPHEAFTYARVQHAR